MAGDVPPDVVFFDRFAIGEWAGRNALTDLRPFIENQKPDDPYRLDLSEYYAWSIDEASYRTPGTSDKPGIYGIPVGVDVRLLFSSTDLLRQANLHRAADDLDATSRIRQQADGVQRPEGQGQGDEVPGVRAELRQ